MRHKKLAIATFLWSLIASVIIGHPFVTMVLVEWVKEGTNVDWFINFYIAFSFAIVFGSCVFSFISLFWGSAKSEKKTQIVLWVVFGLTSLALAAYLTLIYGGTFY